MLLSRRYFAAHCVICHAMLDAMRDAAHHATAPPLCRLISPLPPPPSPPRPRLNHAAIDAAATAIVFDAIFRFDIHHVACHADIVRFYSHLDATAATIDDALIPPPADADAHAVEIDIFT